MSIQEEVKVQAVQKRTDRSQNNLSRERSASRPGDRPKKVAYVGLRISKSTKSRLERELEKINQKEFGRKIRADELLDLALSLVTPQHLSQLKEASLTHADRLERDYREYTARTAANAKPGANGTPAVNGAVTRDQYLGMRLTGEIPLPTQNRVADTVLGRESAPRGHASRMDSGSPATRLEALPSGDRTTGERL